MEYRHRPHRRKADLEEVGHPDSPERTDHREPKGLGRKSLRPPLVGRRQDLVDNSSEKAVEPQADGNEGHSDVLDDADGADHEGNDGDFTGLGSS